MATEGVKAAPVHEYAFRGTISPVLLSSVSNALSVIPWPCIHTSSFREERSSGDARLSRIGEVASKTRALG